MNAALMPSDQAAWVEQHVIADYHLANEDTFNDPDQGDRSRCACQLPCPLCRYGRHADCRRIATDIAKRVAEGHPWKPLGYGPDTTLHAPAPWRPPDPKRPLWIRVWLADRVCRYLCDCTTCAPASTPTPPLLLRGDQLDLFGGAA